MWNDIRILWWNVQMKTLLKLNTKYYKWRGAVNFLLWPPLLSRIMTPLSHLTWRQYNYDRQTRNIDTVGWSQSASYTSRPARGHENTHTHTHTHMQSLSLSVSSNSELDTVCRTMKMQTPQLGSQVGRSVDRNCESLHIQKLNAAVFSVCVCVWGGMVTIYKTTLCHIPE
jgi:hypothetical protein